MYLVHLLGVTALEFQQNLCNQKTSLNATMLHCLYDDTVCLAALIRL